MSKIPEIRIYFSFLLFYGESSLLAGKEKLESYEQYEEWTDAYQKEWKKHETKILTALQQALGVTFYKPIIDVACAPYFIPKSDPLIMNFRNKPDRFVDVLVHELCHVLLTDNNVVQIKSWDKPALDLFEEWQKLFGEQYDFNTLVHIPVHALSKYIYLDVLKEPKRLERDLETAKNEYKDAQAYRDAWEYADRHDYRQIIADLRDMYEEAQK